MLFFKVAHNPHDWWSQQSMKIVIASDGLVDPPSGCCAAA